MPLIHDYGHRGVQFPSPQRNQEADMPLDRTGTTQQASTISPLLQFKAEHFLGDKGVCDITI